MIRNFTRMPVRCVGLVALILASCAGAPAAPPPDSASTPTGGSDAAATPAVTTAGTTAAPPVATSAARSGAALAALAELAAAEARVEAEHATQSGLLAAVGAETVAWLATERAATIREGLFGLLSDLDVPPANLGLARNVAPHSPTQPIVLRQEIGPMTAAAALSLTFRGLMEAGYERPTSGALDATRTDTNPSGGTTTTTTTGSANRTGSSLEAELTIVQETSGRAGDTTSTTRWKADLNACPDASGRVTMHIEGELTTDASGLRGGRISRATATMTAVAQVGDDARIASTTYQPPFGPGLEISGQMLAHLTLDAAQDKWRGGACVKIVSSVGASPEAKPSEEMRFTAKPVHVEGGDLDKPIVATFSGKASARPLDAPQRPPAQLTYQAPAEEGPAGVVTLTSTSNRGIGTLDVRFRVALAPGFELQITSSLTSGANYMLGAEATSTALGVIPLRQADGLWWGAGTLSASTPLQSEGCNATRVTGVSTVEYDWLVRASSIPRVTIAAPVDRDGASIKVYVDSGPIPEVGNATTTLLCPPVGPPLRLPSTTPHWEFTFFQAHATERGGYGVAIDNWDVVATEDTWSHGGVIATRTVTESCGLSPIPCSGTSTFILMLLPP